MAWTVTNALRDHLAGGGSLQSSMNGGSLRIYNSSATLLSSHTVGTTAVTANVVTVPFGSSTVEAGVSNQTADNAEILNSSSVVLLSTNDVGTAGADIPFNQVTGWNAGDTVDPGDADITLTVAIAV